MKIDAKLTMLSSHHIAPHHTTRYDQYYTNTTLDDLYKKANELRSLAAKEENYDEADRNFELSGAQLAATGTFLETMYSLFNFREVLEGNHKKFFADDPKGTSGVCKRVHAYASVVSACAPGPPAWNMTRKAVLMGVASPFTCSFLRSRSGWHSPPPAHWIGTESILDVSCRVSLLILFIFLFFKYYFMMMTTAVCRSKRAPDHCIRRRLDPSCPCHGARSCHPQDLPSVPAVQDYSTVAISVHKGS